MGKCVPKGFSVTKNCGTKKCIRGRMRLVSEGCRTDAGCLNKGKTLKPCKVGGKKVDSCECYDDGSVFGTLLVTETGMYRCMSDVV